MTESHHIEQALIGSLLKYGEHYANLRSELSDSDFDFRPFQDALRAMETLYEQGLRIDPLTVGDELDRSRRLDDFCTIDNHSFGRAALSIIRDEGYVESAESYARQVRDYAAKRTMLQILTEAAAQAKNGRHADDLQHDLIQQLTSVKVQHKAASFTKTLKEAMSAAYDKTLAAGNGDVRAIPTGLVDLNGLLGGGLFAPDLYIIAARPGMGKTSQLMTMAKSAGECGHHVAIFSLEMSSEQLAMRLIQMETGISFEQQRSGRLSADEWTRYNEAVAKFAGTEPFPIIINDMPAITVGGMRRELNRMGDVDLVMVDYLQLADADGKHENRVQEVTEISKGLKGLAKEFNVPVVAAAQLNRAVEQRADKKPNLSDLRESGSIEQDADVVAFLYRPEDAVAEFGMIPTTMSIAKHRNGKTSDIKLLFNSAHADFVSATDRHINFG